MSKHTPEPWYFQDGAVYGSDFVHISGYDYPAPDGGRYSSKSYTDKVCDIVGCYDNEARNANADRIVSCINNCAGINPEGVPDVVEALRDMLDGYERLLAQSVLDVNPGANRYSIAARAALAKLEIQA